MKFNLKTTEDTNEFGACLARCLQAGDVVALVGDLGAGKTTLSQSIGQSLGVTDYMTSPTFAIVNQYHLASGLFVHADLYRLDDEEALYEIGFEQYFDDANIVVIEWADKFRDWLNAQAEAILWIELKYKETGRTVQLSGAPQLIKKLEAACF